MSITAYKVEAVGHDRTGTDYGYVNIMYRYGNKKSCPRPEETAIFFGDVSLTLAEKRYIDRSVHPLIGL